MAVRASPALETGTHGKSKEPRELMFDCVKITRALRKVHDKEVIDLKNVKTKKTASIHADGLRISRETSRSGS